MPQTSGKAGSDAGRAADWPGQHPKERDWHALLKHQMSELLKHMTAKEKDEAAPSMADFHQMVDDIDPKRIVDSIDWDTVFSNPKKCERGCAR